MAQCEPCRRDCRESREAIALVRAYWQISEDTNSLLAPSRQRQGSPSGPIVRAHWHFRRSATWAAVAACLIFGMIGWRTISERRIATTPRGGRVTSRDADRPLVIPMGTDAGGAIETLAAETKSLLLNGRHRVVMNAGTRLSIDVLREEGRVGCLVNLARGEVYVHVEHDGKPFVVETAHGRAVITGTTFDVQAGDAGTTLVVVEGRVRFASDGGAVGVIAGHASMIAAGSAGPSMPALCDAAALTAWARPAGEGRQTEPGIRTGDSLLDDPLLPSPSVAVRPDLDGLDYGQWLDRSQDWFRRQFPWIFAFKSALTRDGIDVEYDALLVQSGDIWRFGHPHVALGRQIERDPETILRLARDYGYDESWLEAQGLLSQQHATRVWREATAPEAFARWVKTIETQINTSLPNAGYEASLASLDSCSYLIQTRVLAAQFVRRQCTIAPEVKANVLALLREELEILADCTQLSLRMSLERADVDSCECSHDVSKLVAGIRAIGELEEKVKEYRRVVSPQARPTLASDTGSRHDLKESLR